MKNFKANHCLQVIISLALILSLSSLLLSQPQEFPGVLVDRPTIGCAKSLLVGVYEEPKDEAGSFSYLYDSGEIIGVALRTRDNVQPVFVSVGHKITLDESIEIVMKTVRGYRIPEPTRQAHLIVNALRNINLTSPWRNQTRDEDKSRTGEFILNGLK
jgi:hypothetical protein